jgi:hypothetical protein
MTTLEDKIPANQLNGFPFPIISRMLDEQYKQTGKADIGIFERQRTASTVEGGFDWHNTAEEPEFWQEVVRDRNFDMFFERYPMQ